MMPLVGMWTADLSMAESPGLSGQVAVTIGNLTLQGAVYRAEPFAGQTRVRLVAGKGGWRNVIASQGYGSGSGVHMSTVLSDAASACGESFTSRPIRIWAAPGREPTRLRATSSGRWSRKDSSPRGASIRPESRSSLRGRARRSRRRSPLSIRSPTKASLSSRPKTTRHGFQAARSLHPPSRRRSPTAA